MRPISPQPGPRPGALKRKASEDLADLMTDMTLGNGKAPSAVSRDKRPRVESSPSASASTPSSPAAETDAPHSLKRKASRDGSDQAGPSQPAASRSLKRKASIDESGEAGPSARDPAQPAPASENPKRARLVPRGQTEKSYAGGDRDFRNPDGSSVHKPMQGPVSVHFDHNTVVIGNGDSVKIDHPDGTTVLSMKGQPPTVIKPFRKGPETLPGGGRLEHLDGGDARVYLQDRVVTHFGSGLTRTEMHPAFSSQRGFYETDSDGAHRFVESRSP